MCSIAESLWEKWPINVAEQTLIGTSYHQHSMLCECKRLFASNDLFRTVHCVLISSKWMKNEWIDNDFSANDQKNRSKCINRKREEILSVLKRSKRFVSFCMLMFSQLQFHFKCKRQPEINNRITFSITVWKLDQVSLALWKRESWEMTIVIYWHQFSNWHE